MEYNVKLSIYLGDSCTFLLSKEKILAITELPYNIKVKVYTPVLELIEVSNLKINDAICQVSFMDSVQDEKLTCSWGCWETRKSRRCLNRKLFIKWVMVACNQVTLLTLSFLIILWHDYNCCHVHYIVCKFLDFCVKPWLDDPKVGLISLKTVFSWS